MSKKLTIGLICGGTSGEHEVSLISAYNIQVALDRDKYDVLLIGIDKSGAWFLGKTPEFLDNVDDVRQVKFRKNLPILLPQTGNSAGENLASTEQSGNELANVDVFFPITHGNLVKTVHCRAFWNCLVSHMLVRMFMVQQFAWTRMCQNVCCCSVESLLRATNLFGIRMSCHLKTQ